MSKGVTIWLTESVLRFSAEREREAYYV